MEENCTCTMAETITHLKDEIADLKSNNKEYVRDMASLKESHTETKIYVKQIFDSLATLSVTLKEITDKPNKHWEQLISTIITVAVTAGITFVLTK